MVGSGFPYSEFLPEEGQARGVQIDIDGRMLSHPLSDGGQPRRRQRGDAARADAAAAAEDRPDVAREIEKNVARMVEAAGRSARWNAANPINPQRVFCELSPRLPDDCILSADSGSTANWYARDLKIRARHDGHRCRAAWPRWARACRTRSRRSSRYPDRAGHRLVGDGAMQMNGMNELITMAKYWKRWADPRLSCWCSTIDDLNLVTWEQRVHGGRSEVQRVAGAARTFTYARYAELLGLAGHRVDDPDTARRGMG